MKNSAFFVFALYSVTFNAASLSSGVYFYGLIAGSFAITKKLTAIK
jgi:hypothetical protein